MRHRVLIAGITLACAAACSGGTATNAGTSSGGSTSSRDGGGSSATGGSRPQGGAAMETGGVLTSGGANSGGMLGAGGAGSSEATGGNVSSGGSVATGGKSFTGGQPTLGGSIGTGGKAASGGTAPAGGKAGTGGAVGTGGNSTSASGGKANSGGSTSSTSSSTSISPIDCTRDGLLAAVNTYINALNTGDTSKMPLASSLKYTEVDSSATTSSIASGPIWKAALPVDYNRNWLDTTGCEAYTEIFITGGGHPYVLGTRLAITGSQISEIYTLVTDAGDWNFDATAYETCSKSEDWTPVPAEQQSTRDALIAAANAYFTYFADPNKDASVVPWGNPCYRLEGGKSCTPQMDKSSTSCNVGITQTVSFATPHFVVDVELGTAVALTRMGGQNGLPDCHLFGLKSGKIRYIHTLTICTVSNCGM